VVPQFQKMFRLWGDKEGSQIVRQDLQMSFMRIGNRQRFERREES
jgi:hypothetical protein